MMENAIYFFGKSGLITQGESAGWSVQIIDDTEGDTGGYFVVLSDNSSDDSDIFDWWLEKKEHIPVFIDDMGWVIQWPE